MEHAYDGASGTAGGPRFGAALQALAERRELGPTALAAAGGLDPTFVAEIIAGRVRVGSGTLATLCRALRLRAIEFLQQTELLSLAVYAGGLDPLFFLPDGPIRYDARIYMREINPRHAVPEGDMTKRNNLLRAIADDTLLDPIGKLELELAYFLRTAAAATGGSL